MSRYEHTYECRNDKFRKWLTEPYDGISVYRDEPLYRSNIDFINYLSNKLIDKLKSYNLKITDEKQFKDEKAAATKKDTNTCTSFW